MTPSKRSMRDLAEQALQVQDAVNLGALAPHFAQAVVDVRARLTADGRFTSTEDVNRHPIVALWLDKLVQLNGMNLGTGSQAVVSNAYSWIYDNFPDLR